MKRKRNIKSEIQKLFGIDKEEKLKPAAEKQSEPVSQEKVKSGTEKQASTLERDDAQAEEIVGAKLEDSVNEKSEPMVMKQVGAERKTEEQVEVERKAKEPVEVVPKAEEQVEVEPKTVEQVKAETKTGEQVEAYKKEPTVPQIDNQIKIGVTKQINLSICKNRKHDLHRQTIPELNTSTWVTKQAYTDFIKIIMGKYGFERLKSQFSKLIFRQYSSMLEEDETKENAASDTIIKNYSNYYNVNKSVFNLITRSLGPNNIKINKELKVPFYILEKSQSTDKNQLSNKQEYEKENTKLMYRDFSEKEQNGSYTERQKEHNDLRKTVSINTLKIVDSIKKVYEKNNEYYIEKVNLNSKEQYPLHPADNKLIEKQKRENLIGRVNNISQTLTEPMCVRLKLQTAEKQLKTLDTHLELKNSQNSYNSDKLYKPSSKLLYDDNQQPESRAFVPKFSKPVSFEKENLSNRTSIGSNIGIINRSNSGSTNEFINRDINANINRITNRAIDENNIRSKNSTTNDSNNQTRNRSSNSATVETKYEITNQVINRTINEAANGSSNKNTTNNVITNRITNGIIYRTINGSSNGIINKATNIITNKVKNRLENSINTNISPSTQLSLRKNNDAVDVVEIKSLDIENTSKDEKQKNKVIENLNQSDIILHTTAARNNNKPKFEGFIKNSMTQVDSMVSTALKNFSSNQKAESDEYKPSKSTYQNKTSLIPAEVQNRQIKGLPNFTGKLLDDRSLTLCKPRIETSIKSEEAPANVIKSDNQVNTMSVTPSKRRGKINEIEVEEVNQIAEKVFKIIEKRIAIQKDRRGLG